MVSMGTLVKLTDASVADIDRNGNQSMPFAVSVLLFFFLFPFLSLLLRLSLGMKRKSRTSCQPIALAFGPLSAG